MVCEAGGMPDEAEVEKTEFGRVAKGDGWYVLNARDAQWRYIDGRPALCNFEGDQPFSQVGININVLEPGQPLCMYHWEAGQEDFLVLSGEALLVIEEQERPLRQWDFVHCPPQTKHVIVGAGASLSVILAVGARVDSVDNPDWGAYPVSDAAARHGAGVDKETSDPNIAYAACVKRKPAAYQERWLD